MNFMTSGTDRSRSGFELGAGVPGAVIEHVSRHVLSLIRFRSPLDLLTATILDPPLELTISMIVDDASVVKFNK
jgi:hypothetical protein